MRRHVAGPDRPGITMSSRMPSTRATVSRASASSFEWASTGKYAFVAHRRRDLVQVRGPSSTMRMRWDGVSAGRFTEPPGGPSRERGDSPGWDA